MICSLTKTAAAEVRRRNVPLAPEAIGTMHAHCYRLLNRPEIAESHIKEWNESVASWRITKTGKINDAGDEAPAAETYGDRCFAEYTLNRARMLPRDQWSRQALDFAEAWETWKESKSYLDFEDLIEQAKLDSRPPGNPQIIYLDEAQDSSASEIDLAVNYWARYANIVMVGDIDQSIYGWRGACPETFQKLPIEPQHRRVLEQSYRVPRAVHDRAVRWISQIRSRDPVEYRPRDEDGSVREIVISKRFPEELVRQCEKSLIEGNVMVLASCAYMLAPLIAVLRKRGIPFHNPFRARDGRWNPLGRRNGKSAVDRIQAFLRPQTSYRWSVEDLKCWMDVVKSQGVLTLGAKSLLKKWETEGKQPGDDEISSLFDRGATGAFEAIESAWDGRLDWFRDHIMPSKAKSFKFPFTVAEKQGIEALTAEPQIILGTVHSVKGAEAATVLVLPDLSRAAFEGWMRGGEDRHAVIRLFYVAMTRAKKHLVLCAPGGPMAVKW